MKDVEVIEVVRTTLVRRGRGVEGDPVRRVTQYWTIDGDLLAEVDGYESGRRVQCGDLVGDQYVVTALNLTTGDVTVGRKDEPRVAQALAQRGLT